MKNKINRIIQDSEPAYFGVYIPYTVKNGRQESLFIGCLICFQYSFNYPQCPLHQYKPDYQTTTVCHTSACVPKPGILRVQIYGSQGIHIFKICFKNIVYAPIFSVRSVHIQSQKSMNLPCDTYEK